MQYKVSSEMAILKFIVPPLAAANVLSLLLLHLSGGMGCKGVQSDWVRALACRKTAPVGTGAELLAQVYRLLFVLLLRV